MRVTASDLLRAIAQLPKNRDYNYINPKTRGKIRLVSAVEPEGPIFFRRYNPSKGEKPSKAEKVSISASALRRVANAIREGVPLNIDRVLGASYNFRAVLESLLAYTPQFYFCYPGRIEIGESSQTIHVGHKHLLWLPNEPHGVGVTQVREVNVTVSEIPSVEAVYEALVVPGQISGAGSEEYAALPPEVQRRHTQIQIALVEIGRQLGFKTWVAQNDKGITYKGMKIGEMDGVIVRLEDIRLLTSFDEAIKAALLIDCIWFKNGKLMPAVIEVEHTTGVTSGLTRMQNLKTKLPPFPTRYVIAAADEDREKVLTECNREQFRDLKAQFFPYSAIEELYSLCQRRKIRGVSEEFIDSFMEQTLQIQ